MEPNLIDTLAEQNANAVATRAREMFNSLIQPTQYVGDVYSIGYETALVQIHDYFRRRVGGIPSLCFLVATRIRPSDALDYQEEDSSVLLLRVMDAAPLPNDQETQRIRVETGQRVSGEVDVHWDDATSMDAATNDVLSFAGVKCRVIGTFYLAQRPGSERADDLVWRFGGDLSNYYPNRGLKVYKPNGKALEAIVNYRDPDRPDERTASTVVVGDVRYASTNRAFQGVSDVPVQIAPGDLLGQKTALFGMTRTGKSNTTKIIIKTVFDLRRTNDRPLRVGQIVFDPNGEYANDNEQDGNALKPTCIKNIGRARIDEPSTDIVTYGITPHPNDPNRILMLLNFLRDENLQTGKTIIDAALANDSAKYIRNFCQVVFEAPDGKDFSAMVRHKRRVLAYRALLISAGFAAPDDFLPELKGLFNESLRIHLEKHHEFAAAARILGNGKSTWGQVATALASLYEFIMAKDAYSTFNDEYMSAPGASGDAWADDDLKKILEMFKHPNGTRQVGRVKDQHTEKTKSDYADDIYKAVCEGKLVIIDQSSGDPDINAEAAERIMWKIFSKNQDVFRKGQIPPDILMYAEEAHNLLPSGSDFDPKSKWVRLAKEGAKYRLGLIYATQEVSSIQRNILKNTANWFIGHLNNTDETKELCKYYDFADFEPSIRRAQDRGFLRVKTLSNLFVVPVQITKFEA